MASKHQGVSAQLLEFQGNLKVGDRAMLTKIIDKGQPIATITKVSELAGHKMYVVSYDTEHRSGIFGMIAPCNLLPIKEEK